MVASQSARYCWRGTGLWRQNRRPARPWPSIFPATGLFSFDSSRCPKIRLKVKGDPQFALRPLRLGIGPGGQAFDRVDVWRSLQSVQETHHPSITPGDIGLNLDLGQLVTSDFLGAEGAVVQL